MLVSYYIMFPRDIHSRLRAAVVLAAVTLPIALGLAYSASLTSSVRSQGGHENLAAGATRGVSEKKERGYPRLDNEMSGSLDRPPVKRAHRTRRQN